jgi:uncharacterized membrane protein YdjX (TVP38/TMEM64 family)
MLGTVMTGVMVTLGIVAGVAIIAHLARRGTDRLAKHMLARWQAWDDEIFERGSRDQRTGVDDEELR